MLGGVEEEEGNSRWDLKWGNGFKLRLRRTESQFKEWPVGGNGCRMCKAQLGNAEFSLSRAPHVVLEAGTSAW